MIKKFLKNIFVFFLAICLSSCSNISGEKKNIAVIVKSTTSDFWQNVKRGVNAGATEFNANVIFSGPGNEEDYVTQNNMIKMAADNKNDAILVSAIDFNLNKSAVDYACDKGVKVIAIDSLVNSDKISTFIGTDNKEAGIKAGKALDSHFYNNRNLNIGIIDCHNEPHNIREREEGFKSYIKNLKNAEIVATIHSQSNATSATASAISLIKNHPEINVIVAFNELTTLGIGNAIKETGKKDSIYAIGFDTNVISVEMLETGEMDALIVQNPFAIGYIGIKAATEILNNKEFKKEVYTSSTFINKKNMYDKDNQKLLFKFR